MIGAIGVLHRQTTLAEPWQRIFNLRLPGKTLFLYSTGTTVAKQRNEIALQALERGADWLLFIDDDHMFPDNALERLLAWDVPIVGGHYLTRTPPYRSTASRLLAWPTETSPAKFQTLGAEDLTGDGLVDVDCLGMGFTLIRRAVFTALPRPWFQLGRFSPEEMGEDTWFTASARKAGFRVCVDAGLQIAHLSVKAVIWGDGRVQIRELKDAAVPVTVPERAAVSA